MMPAGARMDMIQVRHAKLLKKIPWLNTATRRFTIMLVPDMLPLRLSEAEFCSSRARSRRTYSASMPAASKMGMKLDPASSVKQEETRIPSRSTKCEHTRKGI